MDNDSCVCAEVTHSGGWRAAGQKTRRDNEALITGTAPCVISGCSVFYPIKSVLVRKRESEKVSEWGSINSSFSLLRLWSFPYNGIFSRSSQVPIICEGGCSGCSCSAGLCLVSLTLSKADHAIPSTPTAGQEHNLFTGCLPRRPSS